MDILQKKTRFNHSYFIMGLLAIHTNQMVCFFDE